MQTVVASLAKWKQKDQWFRDLFNHTSHSRPVWNTRDLVSEHTQEEKVGVDLFPVF